MTALEKFNEAFDYEIVAPDASVVRAMIDVAKLRGRRDIAAELEFEAGWREHLILQEQTEGTEALKTSSPLPPFSPVQIGGVA